MDRLPGAARMAKQLFDQGLISEKTFDAKMNEIINEAKEDTVEVVDGHQTSKAKFTTKHSRNEGTERSDADKAEAASPRKKKGPGQQKEEEDDDEDMEDDEDDSDDEDDDEEEAAAEQEVCTTGVQKFKGFTERAGVKLLMMNLVRAPKAASAKPRKLHTIKPTNINKKGRGASTHKSGGRQCDPRR